MSVRLTFDVSRPGAHLVCIGRVVGALLACERRPLFPPCLRAFSPAARNLPRFFFPLAARARPSALTLIPPAHSRKNGAPYSVAPLLVRRPRFSLSAHRLRFPSRRGSRSSAVALAPPRLTPSRDAPCAYSPTVGCRGCSPFFEKTGEEETFLSLRRENNQFSKVRFRFNMRGFRVPRAPATARRGGYSLTIVLGTPRCPATYWV